MDFVRSCAFTGHRDIDGDFDINMLKETVKGLIEEGFDTFLCGMARGFDLIAAACILKLKKRAKIKLIACVPCPDQDKYYCEADKKEYARILKKCDEVRVLNPHYYSGCMQMRDRYMVDNCEAVISYYRGVNGGTGYTLRYAMKCGKRLLIL